MVVSGVDIERIAAHFVQMVTARGATPGDRVCISAPNSIELLALVYGLTGSGMAPAVISSSATHREIAEMCADIDAKVLITGDDLAEFTRAHAELEPIELGEDSVKMLSRPRCRPMHFTSGTSGRPKAVWSGWLTEQMAAAWIDDETSAWDITGSDVHLVCGPLSHSAPLRFALMTLWAGGSVIVSPKFDAAAVAEVLPSVTSTFMAPTHLQRLIEFADGSTLQHDLRLLAHAGSACPDRVRLWAHETFGTDVVREFYGSTEGQFTVCSAAEWVDRPGTVGRARPGRAMRVDEDGRLWSTAPAFAQFEYWADPEKTAQAWDGDWFTVGDYGHIDDDGYVYLQGRRGDLIISGGVNVYPAEIERVLSNLIGVEQVVAFALPDEQWGQRVCVAITGSVSEADVRNYALDRLSGPKRPKSVFIVESLPTTHSGKVDRMAVPALFA